MKERKNILACPGTSPWRKQGRLSTRQTIITESAFNVIMFLEHCLRERFNKNKLSSAISLMHRDRGMYIYEKTNN